MTPDRLRELYGPTNPRAAVKVIDHLDHHCRDFIAAAPFLVLATGDGTTLDVSPKGDPAGFVVVEDDHHLLIPDRPGNNRIDGLLNILKNPAIGLIFLIPGVDETLRVNGNATIHEDVESREKCALKGRLPLTVTRVAVAEAFSHCGKAPIRAGLWKPESWAPERPVATLFEMVRDHGNVEVPTVDQAEIEAMYHQELS